MSFQTYKGDLADDMTLTTDANYTGYSGFTIMWRPRGTTEAFTVGTGSLVLDSSDASGSQFTYSWAAGETDTAGAFEAKIQGTSGGKVLTTPTQGGYPFQVHG